MKLLIGFILFLYRKPVDAELRKENEYWREYFND